MKTVSEWLIWLARIDLSRTTVASMLADRDARIHELNQLVKDLLPPRRRFKLDAYWADHLEYTSRHDHAVDAVTDANAFMNQKLDTPTPKGTWPPLEWQVADDQTLTAVGANDWRFVLTAL